MTVGEWLSIRDQKMKPIPVGKWRNLHNPDCIVELVGECEWRTGELKTAGVIYTKAGRVFGRKRAEFVAKFSPLGCWESGK